MKKITNFSIFLKESAEDKLSTEEVISYITDITPNDSAVPDYFFSLVRKSKKNFFKKRIKIKDLLDADRSLKEYVMSGEKRYGEEGESKIDPLPEDLYNPIVVFDGEVIDGYNRTSVLYHTGEEFIDAYISE
jgi:hypothetical protein